MKPVAGWCVTIVVGWLVAATPGRAEDAERLRVVVDSATHPSVQGDFESTTAPLEGRPPTRNRMATDEPPTVAIRRVDDPERGGVALLTNDVSGGFFGVTLAKGGRDTPVFTTLSFDYRADPDLKANLFYRVSYEDHEIGFTGPPDDSGSSVWVGQAPEVAADGQWHRLELPILRAVQPDRPLRARARFNELVIENRHEGDYLLAGFGGNSYGTRLWLDNFYLGRPGPATATFTWRVPGGAEVAGYAAVVDQQPDTVPAETVTTETAELTVEGLADGTHWLHVRARAADGGWGPTTHHRFDVDTQPPTAADPQPAEGAEAAPPAWTCQLVDAGAGVAPGTIAVKVGDAVLGIEHPAVTYEPWRQTLSVDLARLHSDWPDGRPVVLEVSAEDELGHAMPAPFRGGFVLRRAADATPPEQPRVLLRTGDGEPERLPGDGTFEFDLDEWLPLPNGGALLERTTETAASGQYSLKLRCTENASSFACSVRQTPFDAAKYRILSFDYKVPERLRVDLYVQVGPTWRRIRFTDRDQTGDLIGEVPNVVADDTWRHTELNLHDMLRRAMPGATDFTVSQVLLSGTAPAGGRGENYPGNYAGTTYYLDNVHFVPVVGADTDLVWSGEDLTGVTGALVATAETLDALPGADATGGEGVRRVAQPVLNLAEATQGLTYLWARVFDAQGNLAQPLVTRLLVDAERPRVGEVWPADGSRTVPTTIGVELRDDEGLSLDSLALEVAGEVYGLGEGSPLRYDREAGRLIWDGRRAAEPIVLPNGATVPVRLVEARDDAGNRAERLPQWSFTVDYGEDRTGPVVQVRSSTHPSYLLQGFEEDDLNWQPATPTSRLSRVPGFMGQGLEVTAGEANQPYGAILEFEPESLLRANILAFDYRLPAGVEVDVILEIEQRTTRRWMTRAITLTDTATDQTLLGQAEDIIADGQWHRALIPVVELVRADRAFTSPYTVRRIAFADAGESTVAAGEGFAIDNVMLFRQASVRHGSFRWTADDPTGVAGYSYLIDDQPTTEPPAKIATQDEELARVDLEPGVRYLHIRAQDGAGNWGPTTHYLLLTPERRQR